ncbi:SLATT domain-containing protein [Hyphomicrobium sp.]|uniref:SLATT domain-containing protein n=1 Tax=Hyphomicrobium sp. TaxID=82 RepID=UPI002E3440EB|nr:SLATT domain-containing protein [Hyphomicrobium sp.]HEX2841381.1 SLATT domain-containing protein [Hyphomicrobium sp.]
MKKDGIRAKTLTLYEDTLYTEKALFWLATNWRRAHYLIGLPSCIVSALAGVAVINEAPALAAFLTITAAVLTALLTFLDPKATYTKYHECGVGYGILRGKVERFKDIDLEGKFDEEAARIMLERFAEEKGELQKTAPHTGGVAYFFAKRSIQKGQHTPDAAPE